MYTNCQTPTSSARKTTGGSTERTAARPVLRCAGVPAADSSASRPATTDRSSATLPSRVPRRRSVTMPADLLVQVAGHRRGQRADLRRLDGARVGDVDRPLAHDTAG